jgi:hypothetical protein
MLIKPIDDDFIVLFLLALYGFQGLFVKLDEWKIHF